MLSSLHRPLSRDAARELGALQEVQSSPWVRRVARFLAIVFVLFPLFLLLSPWQQNLTGAGQVSAFAPLDRQQPVEAPIDGRIKEVWVVEGSKVKKGDRLLEIEDIDPNVMTRYGEQRTALIQKLTAAKGKITSLETGVRNLELSRDLAVEAYEARVDVAEEKEKAAVQKLEQVENDLGLAKLQVGRFEALVKDGVVSQYDVDKARLDFENAEAKFEGAEADLEAARKEILSAQASLGHVREKANAEVEKARADVRSAQGDVNDVEARLASIEVTLARQSSQLVVAPRDGTVFRLVANQGGEIVKAGDPLLILIPETVQTAVELWVKGNDAPLIDVGRKVRLQFEGWPAVQFAGWPSVAVGTFGGVVALVDPTDNGNGRFRLLITPDPNDQPWPADRFLRQGVRTKGWVLLEQVSLGYEFWRQLNGFPPVVAPEEPKEDVARKRVKP